MAYKPKHLPLVLFGIALTPIATIQLLTTSNSIVTLALTAFLAMMAGVAISMGTFEHMRHTHRNQ